MGLTRQPGSSTSSSTPNQGTPGEVTVKPADDLAHMPFISDSNVNKFAIDTTQYADVTRQLVGFAKGKRVTVTYYRLLNREGINNRSNIADLPNARSSVETEYQKIIGLEITLPKGFDFTINNDQASMQITGQAMLYPNMNPSIGDMFLMGTGDGRVGVCRVSKVDINTWRTDRIFMIGFVVQEFLEHALSDPLEASVTITSYFSKENYLGGTAALLSEQSYLQLAKIREQRIILSQLFHQAFYDSSVCSYIRPDGIYDPWVVLFMCGKLRMEDVFLRPRNLLGQQRETYQRTLWARLGDEHNNTLNLLLPCAQMRGYDQTRMGSFITELDRNRIIYPMPKADGLSNYVFSANFYEEKTALMTADELLVYEAILYKTSGPLTPLILNHLDPVFKLPLDQQFYKIPICIHLIDMALRSQYREIDAPALGYASSGDE